MKQLLSYVTTVGCCLPVSSRSWLICSPSSTTGASISWAERDTLAWSPQ